MPLSHSSQAPPASTIANAAANTMHFSSPSLRVHVLRVHIWLTLILRLALVYRQPQPHPCNSLSPPSLHCPLVHLRHSGVTTSLSASLVAAATCPHPLLTIAHALNHKLSNEMRDGCRANFCHCQCRQAYPPPPLRKCAMAAAPTFAIVNIRHIPHLCFEMAFICQCRAFNEGRVHVDHRTCCRSLPHGELLNYSRLLKSSSTADLEMAENGSSERRIRGAFMIVGYSSCTLKTCQQ